MGRRAWLAGPGVGLCAALALFGAPASAAGAVRAGFATSDLTPAPGLETGGFGYNLGRTGDAVHDRLLARAAVIELDGVRIAIIGCDLGGISFEVTRQTRKLIEDATGIPAGRIMVGTTHTHSAPVVANWLGVGKPDARYVRELPGRIAQAAVAAARKLEPVSAAWGTAPVREVARNREYPGGPLDPEVRVLRFHGPGGQLRGFIANYSVHPVVMSERTRMYTGDVTGVAVNKVVEKHDGAVGVFLQGSCGDINPVHAHIPPDESLVKLDLLATRLASSISEALAAASPFEVKRVAMDARMIALPQVPPEKADVLDRLQTAERLLGTPGMPERVLGELRYRADSAKAVLARFEKQPLNELRTEVQAALIGSVLVVSNPGETFLQFGRETAEALPGYKVMVAGYTNDYVGYIPAADRYDVDKSGLRYPAYLTPWINGEFRYRSDVGDVLVREMVGLARDVIARQ